MLDKPTGAAVCSYSLSKSRGATFRNLICSLLKRWSHKRQALGNNLADNRALLPPLFSGMAVY